MEVVGDLHSWRSKEELDMRHFILSMLDTAVAELHCLLRGQPAKLAFTGTIVTVSGLPNMCLSPRNKIGRLPLEALFLPAPPQIRRSLQAISASDSVTTLWRPSTSADMCGYRGQHMAMMGAITEFFGQSSSPPTTTAAIVVAPVA